tara:strand:- start:773 stop:1429 length:657 start_codon:yes stop_codon:yes gene_type:complete
MKKLIIAISSAFILFANSAMSMDLRPSIGISGNTAVYAATGIEENYNEAGSAIDTTSRVTGAFQESYASIFAEMSLNDVIAVGLDYVPSDIETPENVSQENEPNENKVYVAFEDLTTIYAKLNVPLGGTYLKVGYSTVNVISNETMNSGSKYGNDRTDALVFGLGYAHEVSNGLAVRAEITASEFSDVNTSNDATNKNTIKVEDMIGARGTISVVKSF